MQNKLRPIDQHLNLKHLCDQDLLSKTSLLVQEERDLLLEILMHLQEVERRKLFADLKCASLFDYCVNHLKYSEDQACRRIASMRLLTELPEIAHDVAAGRLKLSQLNLAQSAFRNAARVKITQTSDCGTTTDPAKLSRDAKLQLMAVIKGKSKRETEMILAQTWPEVQVTRAHEKFRAISESKIEVTFTADVRLEAKLKDLKGLLAHKHPNIALGELVELLVDVEVARQTEARVSTKRLAKPNSAEVSPAQKLSNKSPAPVRVNRVDRVPRATSRHIWHRDHAKCANCQSTYALEIDHRKARALGGGSEPENLRLLCRSCNQRSAIRQIGMAKVRAHF